LSTISEFQLEYQKRQERENMKSDPGELSSISDAFFGNEGEETQIFVQSKLIILCEFPACETLCTDNEFYF